MASLKVSQYNFHRKTHGSSHQKKNGARKLAPLNTRNVVSIHKASNVDVLVENQGSIFLFRLCSSAAKTWVEENVQDDPQFLGDGLAVEWRFARDLAAGMQADGLVLQ
jgi:hypothetical protein